MSNLIKLIFFVYPGPEGSEENQFTPPGDGVNKLIFKLRVISNKENEI
jgi:hypothetical protein